MNKSALLPILPILLVLLFGSITSNAQIAFFNPDLERPAGQCNNCVPPGWTKCNATPDVQPYQYAVCTPPKSGNTYAGFAGSERIGQRLACKLIKGKTYNFTLWLAHDGAYANAGVSPSPCPPGSASGVAAGGTRGFPGNLTIFGSTFSCGTTEALWSSGVLPASTNQTWTQYNVVFTPINNSYDYIQFQNSVANANILIDNISQTIDLTPPTVNIIKDVVACGNNPDGKVTITMTGTYVYDFYWSDGGSDIGVTSSTNDTLGVGNHTVTIVDPLDDCAEDIIVNFTIDGSEPIVLDATTVDETCVGSCDGEIDLEIVSGGKAPFTYLWDDPAGSTTQDITGLCEDSYEVTVTDDEGCTAIQTFNIGIAAPAFDPGTDGTLEVCETETATNLFLQLGGTPDTGGAWTDVSGSGGLTDSTFDATGIAAGDYIFKYTLGAAPCIYESLVTITVIELPEAGNGYTDKVCQSEENYDLYAKLTNSVPTGRWEDDPINPGGLSGTSFNASTVPPGIYNLTYIVEGTPPCINDSAFVTIEVMYDPNPGVDTTIYVCNTAMPINLFNNMGGTPDPVGGTWNDDNSTGLLTGQTFNVTGIAGGIYNFTHSVEENLPCLAKSAVLSVDVQEQKDAGANYTLELCDSDGMFILLDSLGGNPDIGGQWTYREGGTNAGPNFYPNVDESGNYDYVIDGDPLCQTVQATLNITVNKKPTVTDVVDTLCDQTNLNYQVRIELSGGDPGSYEVDGTPVGSSTFISGWIPTGTTYNFDIDDAKACGPVTITGAYACDCATRAGTMDGNTLNICKNDLAVANHNLASVVKDPNDSLIYILHTSPNGNIGTVLDTNLTSPTFAFNSNSNMTLGTTYYISPLAGNGLVDQTVDIVNDLCYHLGAGTPVVFHDLPIGTIGNDTTICEGNSADLLFEFTNGTAPFSATVSDGTNDTTYYNLNANDNALVFPSGTTAYELKSVSDVYGCTSTISGQTTTITINPNPTATFTPVNDEFCEGFDPASMDVNITGGTPNFNITYFDAQTGMSQTINNVGLGITNITSAMQFPLAPGVYHYRLTSISDVSSAACTSTFNDTVTVTVHENPEVTFSGSTAICDGESTNLFFDFTKGSEVFTIEYSLNGTSVNPSLSNQNTKDTLQVTPALGNNVYDVTRITDVNGCFTNYPNGMKSVNVMVHPNPTMTVSASNLNYCFGTDNTVFTFNFDPSNTPNFEVDYTLDGGAMQTISNLDFSNNQWTFVPSGPGTYEFDFTYIRDNNCGNIHGEQFTVQVYENPTATISFETTYICEGESATIDFDFTGTSPWLVNYQVDNGPILSFTCYANDTSITYTPLTSSTITLLNVTSTITGCTETNINQTANIIVTEKAIVDISGDNTICRGEQSTLFVNVSQGQGPFALDFNDASLNGSYADGDSIVISPDSLFNYQVVDIHDIANCQWPTTGNQVTIDVIQLPTIAFGNDTNICFGESTPLHIDFLTGRGTNYTVTMDGSDYSVTDNSDLIRSPDFQHTYVITKIVDGSGYNCASDVFLPVTVEVTPLPVSKIEGDNSICENEISELVFTIEGVEPYFVNVADQNFFFDSDTVMNRNDTLTVQPHLGVSTYTVHSVKMVNFPFCASPVDSMKGVAQVQVNPIPKPLFEMENIDNCAPTIPTITNTTSEEYLGQSFWDFGLGELLEINDSVFTPEFILPRSYEATLKVVTPFGCVNEWTHPEKIWVRPDPVADFRFNPDPVTTASPEVNLRNLSNLDTEWEWTIFDAQDATKATNVFNTKHVVLETPQKEGEYLINLHVTSEYACTDEVQKLMVVVGEMLINVPNTFTPNGDGVNDVFEPIIFGATEQDFAFTVYNRWGEVIFESKDLDNKAWDGTYKGEPVNDSQFIYLVLARSKYTEQLKEVRGSFRVMR